MTISDNMIKRLCSSMIYKRGTEYFREGRVHIRKRTDNTLTAVVDGEGLYNVRISFNSDGIDEAVCACPYFETMQTPCKHIIAVLKARQTELVTGGEYKNENDSIAAALCGDYTPKPEKRRIRAAFTLFIDRAAREAPVFEMSVSLPDLGGRIQGLENFLDSYINGNDFKIGRGMVYNRSTMYFPENEDKIISILASVYETRALGVKMYHKESYRTAFGATVIGRILPYMVNMDFKLVYEGIMYSGVRIIEEDPDILLDIKAYEREISVSLSETGLALTPDGEWFLYNDTVYKTSEEWRECFIPAHRALVGAARNEIIFKGDNVMLFAKNVLPRLRDRHGVVINGVDEIIVNSAPEFEVCLDAIHGRVTAVVAAVYGSMKFRIPTDVDETGGRVIVRDIDREHELLSYFSDFDREKSVYTLSGDSAIYRFISKTVPRLERLAKIAATQRYRDMKRDIELSVDVSYRRDIDFLEISFKSDLSPDEIKGILAAMRLGHEFYRAFDGRFIELKKDKSLLRLLERLDLTGADIAAGKKILPKYHMLYLNSRNDVTKDNSLIEYIHEVKQTPPIITEKLKNVLRPYQVDGVRWLTELSKIGMGGILADDMGLGKTLQVTAYICGIKPKKPVLIVTPGALLYNWQHEINKFTPEMRTIIINGGRDTREELLKTVEDYDFVITSYPLLRRDIAMYKSIEFSYCFIDEAQYIKNPKTMNAISVKRIKAEHKFALTGTPVENSLSELWSVFDFIMPGYLKSAGEFRARFELPIMRAVDSLAGAALRDIIRPFVLRRMKADVLSELPDKIESVMLSDLSREQTAMYLELINEIKSDAGYMLGENRLMLLTMLLRLRQICCHPRLVNDAAEKAESGKLELLTELVRSGTGAGHRILIFSQFKSMLDIIAEELDGERVDYFYIHGSVPAQERTDMAEAFNSGERSVFLISLKAGGTGLNLIGADMVIHYDPWWNPAVTDQATDRAYRIGQTRSVQVIKLAARGTIEEKILTLQEKKRTLADDIIRVNTRTPASLTDEEIMYLLQA